VGHWSVISRHLNSVNCEPEELEKYKSATPAWPDGQATEDYSSNEADKKIIKSLKSINSREEIISDT
jgi:hypothetical protein